MSLDSGTSSGFIYLTPNNPLRRLELAFDHILARNTSPVHLPEAEEAVASTEAKIGLMTPLSHPTTHRPLLPAPRLWADLLGLMSNNINNSSFSCCPPPSSRFSRGLSLMAPTLPTLGSSLHLRQRQLEVEITSIKLWRQTVVNTFITLSILIKLEEAFPTWI